jgi:hypothetical protein
MTECLPKETTAPNANTTSGIASQIRLLFLDRCIGRIPSLVTARLAAVKYRQNVIVMVRDGKTMADLA